MVLSKYELNETIGGAVSATLINSLARLATTFITIGQMLGSALKMSVSKNYC